MDNYFDNARHRAQLKQSLAQEIYTVEEAAQAMRMSEPQVRALIKKGELDYLRPTPRRIRIPKQAIIDYLAPPIFKGFFR